MNPLSGNPFAALTFIVAPAILTNASTVLILSTSNRFARAIDRARMLGRQLAEEGPQDPARPFRKRQLAVVERRLLILVRALTAFYVAVGAFAAGTLISLIGATLVAIAEPRWLAPALDATLAAGVIGVIGLGFGAAALVWESRLAFAVLSDEVAFVSEQLRSG